MVVCHARPGRAPPSEPHAERLSDEVELYHRTYTTLLRSSGETRLRVLEPVAPRDGLEPAPAGRQRRARPRRVPLRDPPPARRRSSAARADRHGPGGRGLRRARHRPIEEWEAVEAPARRRRWYDGGDGTLAVLLASASDLDDLDPDARRLPDRVEQAARAAARGRLAAGRSTPDARRSARATLGGAAEDWPRLRERLGRALRRAAARDRRAAAEPARADARRHARSATRA